MIGRRKSAKIRANAIFAMIPVAATTRETFPCGDRAVKGTREKAGERDEETDMAERTHGMEICCSRERTLKNELT